MSLRNLLIRIAADALYILRRRTILSSGTHLIVFTGTSGKTLARTATAYALTKAGKTVVSPAYGYTNELGIVLAALGIDRSVRLHSTRDLSAILTARPANDSYILIEIGADWRTDTEWLTKRFPLAGVCIAHIAQEEWARSHIEILRDKEKLAIAVIAEGFVCWDSANPSARELHEVIPNGTSVTAAPSSTINYRSFTFAVKVPPAIYAPAIGLAAECLDACGLGDVLTDDYFLEYAPPPDRFSISRLPNGATLVSDTYKSIPYCMEHVLTYALALPAKRRIAVVTPMHPVVLNADVHYQTMGTLLSSFDAVYLIGFTPELTQQLGLSKGYEHDIPADLPHILTKEDAPDAVIVVKAAGRYALDPLS